VNPPVGARVLVTGASGLIGRAVLSLLASVDVDVHAVSRSRRQPVDGIDWLACDLARTGSARTLIQRVQPQIVIHLAGAVRGDRALDAVTPTLATNLVATVELLEAATRGGVSRIVMAGSLLEEPAGSPLFPVPPSPYGASRWAASAYARMFHALFDAPVTILRPSYAYGPGQDEAKLIPHVVRTLLEGKRPELQSGERLIDFVFADDVGQAFIAASSAADIEGETIDIGSGETARIRDVVGLIGEMFGSESPRPLFGAVPNRPLEQDVHVDTEIAARLLDWRASTTLEDGLRRTIDWYRARSEDPR